MSALASPEAELAEARAELRTIMRRFFDKNSPQSRVRQVMGSLSGWDQPLWQEMASQLGVSALIIPEEYGGVGYGLNELGVVLTEAGRSLACVPLLATAVLSTGAILLAADQHGKQTLLPTLAQGATAVLVADVSATPWTSGGLPVSGTESGTQWRLNGAVPFVIDCPGADLILAIADTTRGPGLFLLMDGGIKTRALAPMDLTRRLAAIELHNAPAQLLGLPGDGRWVRRLWYRAVAALAAEQAGGSERMVEMCTDYARERIQFGRAIGSFQTIKHRIVDMFVLAESARSAAEAALSSASDIAADLAISAAVAGSWCSEAYTKIASDAIQIYGGIGFTWEHPAHLYLKRAKASQLMLGSPAVHRRVLAAELGLASGTG
jgi:alkylation response protein AidB-like acyl-CoA dehydrogenase